MKGELFNWIFVAYSGHYRGARWTFCVDLGYLGHRAVLRRITIINVLDLTPSLVPVSDWIPRIP
jgi:hypothetical protein